MAYAGKFKDRSPTLCTAGLVKFENSSVASCLNDYSLDDRIEAVMHEGGLKRLDTKYKQQRMTNCRHTGIFTQTKEVLNPPVETNYQTLLKDLKETIYDSYWKSELGSSRDPIGALPDGLNKYERTFGKPSTKEASMKELINPDRSTYEILYDANEYHPMYRLSHKDYYPAERIDRKYDQPPYVPYRRFGKCTTLDKRGMWVKCAFTYRNPEPLTIGNQLLGEKLLKTHFQTGKVLAPNENIKCVPKGFRFGKHSCRPYYGIEQLLKPDFKPSPLRYDFNCWLIYLNETRQYFKVNEVNLKALIDACRYYDQELTGIIDFQTCYRILKQHNISFNLKAILPLAECIGLYSEEKVLYNEFLRLFDCKTPLPDISQIYVDSSVPDYMTSYQSERLDFCKIDNSKKPWAGTPMRRLDTKRPMKPQAGSRADIDHLGWETSAGTLISPSIFTNYGLSHLDFWQPRTQECLCALFKKSGYEIPQETFKKIWDTGLGHDKTGGVCIDTFRKLLEMSTPFERKPQPEINCDQNLLKKN